jgi:hypothetical protein
MAGRCCNIFSLAGSAQLVAEPHKPWYPVNVAGTRMEVVTHLPLAREEIRSGIAFLSTQQVGLST